MHQQWKGDVSVHTQDAVKGNDSSHSPIFCSNPKRQPIPKNGWQERPTQMMQLSLSLSLFLTWKASDKSNDAVDMDRSPRRTTVNREAALLAKVNMVLALIFFVGVCVSFIAPEASSGQLVREIRNLLVGEKSVVPSIAVNNRFSSGTSITSTKIYYCRCFTFFTTIYLCSHAHCILHAVFFHLVYLFRL